MDRATGRPQELEVKAGAVWQFGETGRMDALDTSPQSAELRSRVDHLLDRIAANSRVTAAGLGTLDATEVLSGGRSADGGGRGPSRARGQRR